MRIEFDESDKKKLLMLWVALLAIAVIAIALIGGYTVGHHSAASENIVSVPPAASTTTPSPTIAPTATPTIPAVVQTPTIAYINNVQSIGTAYGYVCLVDHNGNEFLIMNFYQNTAQLLGASYTGTVVGSYNGIPMVQNVALLSYPADQSTVYYTAYDYNGYRNPHDRYVHVVQKVRCAGTMVCG